MEQVAYRWASESSLWCLMLQWICCRGIWEFRITAVISVPFLNSYTLVVTHLITPKPVVFSISYMPWEMLCLSAKIMGHFWVWNLELTINIDIIAKLINLLEALKANSMFAICYLSLHLWLKYSFTSMFFDWSFQGVLFNELLPFIFFCLTTITGILGLFVTDFQKIQCEHEKYCFFYHSLLLICMTAWITHCTSRVKTVSYICSGRTLCYRSFQFTWIHSSSKPYCL